MYIFSHSWHACPTYFQILCFSITLKIIIINHMRHVCYTIGPEGVRPYLGPPRPEAVSGLSGPELSKFILMFSLAAQQKTSSWGLNTRAPGSRCHWQSTVVVSPTSETYGWSVQGLRWCLFLHTWFFTLESPVCVLFLLQEASALFKVPFLKMSRKCQKTDFTKGWGFLRCIQCVKMLLLSHQNQPSDITLKGVKMCGLH